MDIIYKENKEKNLIIVTHGGTLAYILTWWLKFEPEMIVNAYFSSSVDGITVLCKNDFKQYVVNKFNDTYYFDLYFKGMHKIIYQETSVKILASFQLVFNFLIVTSNFVFAP